MNRFFLIFITVFTQTIVEAQNLRFNPVCPETGRQITLTYSGVLAKRGTKISYICHYFNNNMIPEKCIPYHIENNTLIGSFIIPDSVSYVNIKIINKRESDNNNGEGYGFNVFHKGKPVKGTYFGEAKSIMRNELLLGAVVDEKKAVSLMEKEYILNPSVKIMTHIDYVNTLSQIPGRKNEAIALSQNYFNEILLSGNDEPNAFGYSNIIANGNFYKRDSLVLLVEKKFPYGITSFNMKKWDLEDYSIEKPDTVPIIYNQVISDYKNINFKDKSAITCSLLTAYCNKLDCNNFDNIMSNYLDSPEQPLSYILINKNREMALKLFQSNKNLAQAKCYAEKSVGACIDSDSLSDEYGITLDVYAGILYKLGDSLNALINQRKSVELTSFMNTKLNEHLMELLINNKLYDEAIARAEEFIANQSSNAQIIKLYKSAYWANNGNLDGYDNVLSKKIEKSEQDYLNQCRSKLTNYEAPDFTLRDLDGVNVKLSDLHGKIVILDFWATWCLPCLNSFPAMQKAMDALKDKDVVFLYVNSQEYNKSVNRTEHIKKILKDKNVDNFRVVLDEIKGKEYFLQSAYKVSVFPSKYIIDRIGNIRFCSLGYKDETELIKELKTVMDMIDTK